VQEIEQENGEIPEAKQGGDPPVGQLCRAKGSDCNTPHIFLLSYK
jgi:hypothetical protein